MEERVADYIIRKVYEAGAGHVFMISGRGILYLTDAVARNRNIKPVCTYHEQGASYAAMAYAASSEKTAACLVSTGCAATNAVTACLCAYQDNLPVVFISGNNPLKENTRHTGVKIRTYGSQEADIISMVQSITKYAVMLEDAEHVVTEVEKALHLAQEGRKGPVWIDIPLDVQNMRIDEGVQEHFSIPCINEQEDLQIEAVANELNQAQRPIILIGGGARAARSEIKAFVEKYDFPLVCTPSAADIYGTSHDLSIGIMGSLGGSRAGNFAVQNCDYLLVVGSKLCSQHTGRKDKFAREAKITVVDIDEAEHTQKNGVKIDRFILADAKDFMTALFYYADHDFELESCDKAWVEKCQHWKEVFSINNEPFMRELKDNNEIDLYSLADMLSSNLPGNATIITDAGLEELIIPSSIKYKDGQRCLFPAAQGAMGYAIPAIIGAYEAGRQNIICIVGDGSIMMNLQELQIISALNMPVKIVVINNGMYAVIRKRQHDLFRKRTVGNDPSDGVPAPDFQKIAECFGFKYRLIQNRTELTEALQHTQQSECMNAIIEPEIIEVMCTPEQKYFHESYTLNEKRKLVHRPIEDMSPFLDRDLIRSEMIIDMMEE